MENSVVSHFAEIDDNNVVVRVLVVPDEQEHRGEEFLAQDLNLGGRWVRTSYNARIRKNYAGIGFDYDQSRDAFIAPKPFDSWLLDEETCQWKAPIDYPTDGIMYQWNEDKKDWEAIVNG